MSQWPKRCGCSRSYSADAFRQLAWVGVDTNDAPLILRNCPCGSTLGVVAEGAAALMAKVSITATCWMWTGAMSRSNGYGIFSPGHQKRPYAHRASFEMFRGPLQNGNVVCHTCDVRLCVNPSHMFIGTIADNVHDMWKKGRGKPPAPRRGEKHPMSKLTEADVRAIRKLRRDGEKLTAIAARFGVDMTLVSLIARRKIWTHVVDVDTDDEAA